MFTKTQRRLRQETSKSDFISNAKNISFDKIIVFGHSLNDQDFDYYMYLFTALKFNFFDLNSMGSIEFAYNIYDKSKEDVIREDLADKVYNLLEKYETYITNSNQHVLINLLRFSGKLTFREIDTERMISSSLEI